MGKINLKKYRWTFNKIKSELVFYYVTKKYIKEIAVMPFTKQEYDKLPKSDIECFTVLLTKYKNYLNGDNYGRNY